MVNSLETPRCFHSRHAGPNQTNAEHNTTHPDMRAKPSHDQVRRQVENHISNVKQRQAGRNLVRVDLQDSPEVMPRSLVHRLRQADVGADG